MTTHRIAVRGCGMRYGPSGSRGGGASRGWVARGREVYFSVLSNAAAGADPCGVVLSADLSEGRVVFDLPVLLPDEEFIALDLIRRRPFKQRPRWKV